MERKVVHYVVGFAFTNIPSSSAQRSMLRVLLIEKQRPKWMANRWNGIGGHVEPNEVPHQAMVREFSEETGCQTITKDWKKFLVASVKNPAGELAKLHCFRLLKNIEPTLVNCSMTDEPLQWFEIDQLPSRIVSNTTWLMHMALDNNIISGTIKTN